MATFKEHTAHYIAKTVADIPFNEHHIATVTVAGVLLCLYFFDGNIYASKAECPHAAFGLSGGYVDAKGQVVCPKHFYKFSLKTGLGPGAHEYRLKTYPVLQKAAGIYVLLP